MVTERENNFITSNGLGGLRMRAYDIAGNKIRAFFDDAETLIFVIDDTVTPDKPNALLVINSEDGRKWDDILANDYGVSLEMVRPKKDNKYQKLDIEYIGLDEYDDLIADYDDGLDFDEALAALVLFRDEASYRAASERLRAAESAAENARETIARAQDSIAEQQTRIKTLRAKLSQQKKSVGREPTKQSAAKILRTESQIDALKDKQHRGQRRLDNARRRLVAAEEDAEIARAILARHTVADGGHENTTLPAVAPSHAVVTAHTGADLPAPTDGTVAESDIQFFKEPLEQKAEKMAEEEVKPLFDKDPEFLDEEIAFKPIDFDIKPAAPASAPDAPRFEDYAEPAPVAPLSFVPPTDNFQSAPAQSYTEPSRPAPVLDTITSVEMPAEPTVQPAVAPAAPHAEYSADARPAPVSPAVPGVATGAVRPVSPVTGTPTLPVGGSTDGRKPAFLYYVLLIALIVLSVFTLWLYQKKNGDTVPDLAATVAPTQKEEPASAPIAEESESPFIIAEEKVTVTETPVPEPVVQVQPEPEPAQEPEPEPEPMPAAPIVDETIPAIPVVAEPTPQPIAEETPFLSEPAPAPEPVKPVVVNKPAYNAGSQNDNMFIAGDDYDTDVVAAPAPVVVPAAPEYQETVAFQEDIVCDDGAAPSADGCCGDEVYTNIGGGAYACCSQSSGECYPPMF